MAMRLVLALGSWIKGRSNRQDRRDSILQDRTVRKSVSSRIAGGAQKALVSSAIGSDSAPNFLSRALLSPSSRTLMATYRIPH
jgi:hypothetical protein